MKRLLQYGGVAAGVVLIAIGVVSVVAGISGRSTVRDNLKLEQIVGTPDMTPSGIAKEAKGAGLTGVSLPTCSVAGKAIDSGDRARCFASYMRIHALEASGGKVYAEMPRYAGRNGTPTDNPAQAAVDPKSGKPVDNPARNVWVTETALSTALNTGFFAERVAMFTVAVGAALLLTGVGLLVMALGLLSAPAAVTRRRGREVGAPAVTH